MWSYPIRQKVGDGDKKGWVEKEGVKRREETFMFWYIYIFGEKEFICPMIFSPVAAGWLEDPTEGFLRSWMLIVSLPEFRSVLRLCSFLLNEDEVHRVLAKYDQTLDVKTHHKLLFGRSLQTTANTSCSQTTIRCNIHSSYILILRIPLLLPTGLSS